LPAAGKAVTTDKAAPSAKELAADAEPLDKSAVAAKAKATKPEPVKTKPMSAWRRAYIAKHGHQPPVKAP